MNCYKEKYKNIIKVLSKYGIAIKGTVTKQRKSSKYKVSAKPIPNMKKLQNNIHTQKKKTRNKIYKVKVNNNREDSSFSSFSRKQESKSSISSKRSILINDCQIVRL